MTDSPVSLADLVTQWRVDWLTLAATVLVAAGYLRARLRGRRQGMEWPVRRDVFVGFGLAAAVWTSGGFLQERSDQLMWVWTTQQLILLLVIPIIVLAGQPVSLLRNTDGRSLTIRALDSRPLRVLAHPMVGPLLVPLVAGLLFFGGLGGLALQSTAGGWALHLLLLGLGALIALPLVDQDDRRSALAIGLALAVGIGELLLDAFPGIVLTFDSHVTLAQFALDRPAWAPAVLDDQHTAGGILWAAAEVLDLPFLILVATRWMRADAIEARRIDAELDARAAATAPAATGTAATTPADPPPPSRPWWLDDEQLRDRYRP